MEKRDFPQVMARRRAQALGFLELAILSRCAFESVSTTRSYECEIIFFSS
jgi:hypothetical protein